MVNCYIVKRNGFNTQPREGGCFCVRLSKMILKRFNTQPREGGCFATAICHLNNRKVSTHSRAKAAAQQSAILIAHLIRFNTQPREGGCLVQ